MSTKEVPTKELTKEIPATEASTNGAPPVETSSGSPNGGTPPPQAHEKKKRPFPSALTVLAIVAVGVWAVALILPAGEYRVNSEENPIPHTYHHVHSPLTFNESVRELFLSPVNGLYGIQTSNHEVKPGAGAVGTLFGGAEIFLFVLAVGAFIAVCLATGALDRGMNRLAFRTHKRGWLLIVAIMVTFSVLGSVEGFAEETLAFYGLVIPLMLALGYDRMVAVGAIIVGAGVGVMGSTVNPFSIGIASGFAKVSIIDGMPLRLLMWVVFTAIAIWYVLRYAAKVKAKPETSVVGFLPGDRERAVTATAKEPAALQGKDKTVLWGMTLTFVFMVYSIIPWSEIFSSGSNSARYSWELDWSFSQLTMLFVVAAIIIGVLARMSEKSLSESFTKGMGEFIYPAIVIVMARGVTVIMHNAKVTDTILHAMEHAATGASKGVFAIVIFLVNLPMAFLIPSTSGHATLVMPIFAPLAEFAHVSKALVVTAWNAASGWMNLWIPTTAVVVGGVALAKVPYDKYLKWLAPLLGIYLVVICLLLGLGAAVG